MIKSRPPPLLVRAGLNYQIRHPWQALLALIGISMGVAVVLAVDLANSAAKASFELSSSQLQGSATHRIMAHSGNLSDRVFSKLFTSPGHPPMTPVVSQKIKVNDHKARFTLLGVDIFSEAQFRDHLPDSMGGEQSMADWLSRSDAAAITQSAAVALDVGLNSTLAIEYQGHTHTLSVQHVGDNSSVATQNLIIVDIATAQAISAMQGQLSHIDIILNEASEHWVLEYLPPSAKLINIDQQQEGITGLSAAFELNLTAMSLLALLVGTFLIFNAMSFSIVQRRNLLGRLRALGVHPHELNQVILTEALILAIVGTFIGCLLGIWLGQGLTQIVAATVSQLYYDTSADAIQITAYSLIKAILLGFAGTIMAAWIPARQAAATPPLTTLSRAAIEQSSKKQLPLLALVGLFLMVIGLLIAFYLPGGVISGFAGLFLILLGAALITPLTLPLMHRLLSPLPLGKIWRMATRDIERHLSRLGTATAALMVALAATVGVAIMVDSMRSSVSNWLQELLNADVYIASNGFENGAVLPDFVIKQAPQLDAVSDYSLYRNHSLQVGGQKTRLVGARLAQTSRQGFDLVSQSEQAWNQFDQGAVFISEPLAHRLNLQVDNELTLPNTAGESKYRIGAIFRDYASEHGRIFINLEHYQLAWTDSRINTMALFAKDTDTQALQDSAAEKFDDQFDLVYTRAREIYKESMMVFDQTFRITEVLRLLSILVAFIGILSALMALQLERRKEFAILRALGLTRLQVSQLILIQSILLGLLAALLAIPTGMIMAWILTDAIQLRAFGWTMPFIIPTSPLLQTVLLGVFAALLASLYPAWKASRGNPAPQLRED